MGWEGSTDMLTFDDDAIVISSYNSTVMDTEDAILTGRRGLSAGEPRSDNLNFAPRFFRFDVDV